MKFLSILHFPLSLLLALCASVQAHAEIAPVEWGTIASTAFQSPKDCAPVEVCQTLRAGDKVKISGFIKMEGRDFAVANHHGTAITILKSYLDLTGLLIPPDTESDMPVVAPQEEAARSPIIITPDSDVEYK